VDAKPLHPLNNLCKAKGSRRLDGSIADAGSTKEGTGLLLSASFLASQFPHDDKLPRVATRSLLDVNLNPT
jgi:hypothetical protein